MREITLHRQTTPATELPDAVTVYEAALAWLDRSHEREAAACLTCCKLEIVAVEGRYPLREELQPVRLILNGPGQTISVLERSPEIRGRVRQALDSALGPTIYLAQLTLSTNASALAA